VRTGALRGPRLSARRIDIKRMMRVLLTAFWTSLLLILWVHVVVLGFLLFAPERIEAARSRWPRVARAVKRGQMISVACMLVGASLALTGLIVWLLIFPQSP